MATVASNRLATTVVKTETTGIAVVNGLRWHQIDAGTATTGSLAVNCDFGCGARTVATIDFTDATRIPVLIFGDIKAISLVPTGLDVNYIVTYVATEV